jgi:hypothetical protein
MSPTPEVEPIDGSPAPAAPRPGPVPRRQTRFRTAQPLGGNIPTPIPAFPISEGIAPLIAHADGYQAVEVTRSGLNTAIPSYINICARIFYANQRLVSNDKFLKEVHLYHPDALDLYTSFLFVYQSLRARSEVGQLSNLESNVLSDLLREYPPTALPVPGIIVDSLQTMTATENPYSWLGNICPALPSADEFRGPTHAYLLKNGTAMIYPNFMFLISQLVAHAARDRPTEANFATTLLRHRFTSPGSNTGNTQAPVHLRTDSTERWWLTTPHGRFPSLLTLRIAQSYHDAVYGSANAPFLSSTILDLPSLAAITNATNTSLVTYMAITDNNGITSRNVVYRRWPLQLANMAGIACKYISGSRFLSGIPTTGLGAYHHISRIVPKTILESRDPDVVQSGSPSAITILTYDAFTVSSLNTTLEVRDPVSTDLSIQYQMLAQTNLDLTGIENNDESPATVPNPRSGPFWEYPIGERGPEQAVVNLLLSHLPTYVKANPRRDNSE